MNPLSLGSATPQPSKSEVIRALFAAYLSQDKVAADALLTDGFTFTSPYDDAIDKATYFERCWPNRSQIETHAIEKIMADEDEAFALYRCTTTDGKSFRNVEFFTFENNRIAAVTVYFGPTQTS
jgi:ketosteroid isomerase-like protein